MHSRTAVRSALRSPSGLAAQDLVDAGPQAFEAGPGGDPGLLQAGLGRLAAMARPVGVGVGLLGRLQAGLGSVPAGLLLGR